MEILLVVISTVFASCFCVPEYNITFHGNKTTWIKAVEHCADIGGVLYSKERDIRNQTGDTTVWSGKYEAFTPWALLWGCYVTDFRDRSNKIFTIRDSDLVECQTLCTDTQFFAVYGDKCNCLQTLESSSPIRCGSTKSLKVWKNRISNVGKTSPSGCNSTNTECLCMAAACVRPNLKLTPEHCDQPYRIVCDNGKAMSFTDIKETAYKFCDRQNSILRRYLTAQDICPNGTAQHWTSGWRAVHEYKVSYKDHPLKLDPLRCHMVTTKNTILSDYVPCSEKLPFYCEIDNKQTNKVISENNNTGMIIGIVISISVLVLTILVILAFMYRRTYAKENASSNTAGMEDLNKNDMDNNTVISDYQQLDDVDDVQKNTNAYDQLSVTRNVHTESTNDQANTSFSREEYTKYESIVDSNGINTNTAISDYEKLHKSDKDTSTQAYDQLNVTRKVKTEPTNFFSKITASTEKHSKTESTKATAATSEYEQLDNAKKDKGVNVYDQLHVTDMIDNEQTNYKSKTTKPRDQQSNDKPTEETTKLSKRTVSSEYEHLDNGTKDTSVNVYDNLNDSGVMDNDPTHHNPCQ